MRQLQPVLWTKGLVLSPQHLQAQDRFFEDLLAFQLSSLASWPWGFQRLTMDATSLAKGEIVITEARGALPDGAVFSIPASDAPVPVRSVVPAWHADRPSFTVYLALPESRSDGRNVTLVGEGGTRFAADVVTRRDENTGLAERELQVARRNLRILFETEPLEGYSVLPLTKLRRGKSGEIIEEAGFLPPLLSVSGSRRLQAIAQRVVELLASRGATLSNVRRQRSANLAHFSVSDVAKFWLLYTVNSYLPVLKHLAEREVGHPSDLFAALLGLAGSLTTFSPTIQPRDLPAYDHLDSGPGFLKLDEVVRGLLETAVPESCIGLALKRVEPTIHEVSLDDERLMRPLAAYLSIRSSLPIPDLVRLATQLLKVSSKDRVPLLVRQALPGARITHSPSPPSAVPIRLDAQYFEIARSGPEWDAVIRSRALAAYVPSELLDASLELIVLLPEQS